jgi:hypothetical protein
LRETLAAGVQSLLTALYQVGNMFEIAAGGPVAVGSKASENYISYSAAAWC